MNSIDIIKLSETNDKKPSPSFMRAFGPAIGLTAVGGFGKTAISRQTEGLFHKALLLGSKGRGGLAEGIPYGNPKDVDVALKNIFGTKSFKGLLGKVRKEVWRQYAHAPSALSKAFAAGVLAVPLTWASTVAAKELNK